MISVPGMLMIAAAGRNTGKTQLACSVIDAFCSRCDVIGIKVTTIQRKDGTCPRGGVGCGVCSSLEGNFDITEETDRTGRKDTSRLLAAGAKRVLWLRVLRSHLVEGVESLLDVITPSSVSVCESSSLREVVEPGLFLMVKRIGDEGCKASAARVADRVDRVVHFDGHDLDIDLNDLDLVNGRWVLREHATAIVLAGGTSSRMGSDKAMLELNGRPLIAHVCDQLRPHFDQLLVSADDQDRYAFLGVRVVPDRVAGQGPLMGIASALAASDDDLNVVVACDIPQIDVPFIRRMLAQSEGYDAVIPTSGPSRHEPLFAVYRKTIVKSMQRALADGKRRITDAFEGCRIRYVNLPDAAWFDNINTPEDYQALRRRQRGD